MLILGTVQLGMPYGCNNKTGQPSRADALSMLAYAKERIDWFDTAEAYGSEEILGESGMQGKKVITKLLPNCLDGVSDVKAAVREHLEGSLKRLKLDQVEGYLLHTPRYQYNEEICDAMRLMKVLGLTRFVGSSVYTREEAFDAVHWDWNIQFPFGALDQRIKYLKATYRLDYDLFARAPFTQGAAFTQFPPAVQFRDLCRQYGATPVQGALGYALSHYDNVVFGCETMAQLEEDLAEIPKNPKLYKRIRKELGHCDLMFNSLWAK
jgi:aryl-alcohol dehydrogenase-like predicted oxidoreductase